MRGCGAQTRASWKKYLHFTPCAFFRTGVVFLRADMDVGCGESPPVNPAHRCQPVLFCSAGVPACEFGRRPAARINPAMNPRSETLRKPAAGTAALRFASWL